MIDKILEQISKSFHEKYPYTHHIASDGYLKQYVYHQMIHEQFPDPEWFRKQNDYLHRYGSILAQPEVISRSVQLEKFLALFPELCSASEEKIYTEFANCLPEIHAYRAISLKDEEFEKLMKERAILSRGAYSNSLEKAIEEEMKYGYIRGVRSRIHAAPKLPLDFTLSLHGDKQTALCVSLYSWRPGYKIYLFDVEIPAIQVLNLKFTDVSPDSHYFFFLGVPMDATAPGLEYFVLNKIDFYKNVKTIQRFTSAFEINTELLHFKERLQKKYNDDKKAYHNLKIYKKLKRNAQRLLQIKKKANLDSKENIQINQMLMHPSFPFNANADRFFIEDRANELNRKMENFFSELR